MGTAEVGVFLPQPASTSAAEMMLKITRRLPIGWTSIALD
jgi:hypothetical protein